MKRATLLLLALACAPALAAEPLTLVLNWVPSADYAPFFYAQRLGWFRNAGIELTIESVAGSPEAIKRALKLPRALAVADFVAFLRTRDAKAPSYAILALQSRSPYAMYYAEGTGIAAPKDLAGKRIAAMEQDPMRGLWSALAARNGIDTSGTYWIPLSNPHKPDALAAGEVDAALNPFLHNHLNYQAALGERMRVKWWHELGFEAYGHVLVAGRSLLQEQSEMVRRFVGVARAAWEQCLAQPAPCLDALRAEHAHLDKDREAALWALNAQLHDAGETFERPPGALDSERVRQTFRDLNPGAKKEDADRAAGWVTDFFVRPVPHEGNAAVPELAP